MINKHLICIAFLLITALNLHSQEIKPLTLTIEDAIDLARRQSPSVISARLSFHSSYWNYRNFKADYLPSVNFSSSPNFNHQINPITMSDGTVQFIQQNQFAIAGNLSLSQRIALTGGTLSLNTSINRMDLFGEENRHSYMTNPVSISYSQSLNGYNSMRWSKKIEPLRFEAAKKNYIIALENISRSAISQFFNLAYAQTNLDMALINYQNSDTLYNFGKGRYQIGRITESEMLQLEVSRLNAETSLLNSKMSLDDAMQSFRTFLGIKDTIPIEVIISKTIPKLHIDPYKALDLALENNPQIINMKLRKIDSDNSIAYIKSTVGFQVSLNANVGLSKASSELHSAYKDLQSSQYASIGISVPILDWGRNKGRLKIAEMSRHLTEIQLEQERIDFERGIIRSVQQFNLLANQILIAEKTDYTANKRNEVTQRLYVLGRATTIELNNAISEKDNAKRNYISTLSNFWSSYYNIRSNTLYDFEKNMPLTEDYESLLK
jgi:outer membrane protein TolC